MEVFSPHTATSIGRKNREPLLSSPLPLVHKDTASLSLPSILSKAMSALMVYTSAREEVPQLRYTYGDTRKGWYKKPPVLFSRFGKSGVRLPNAYGVNFEVDEGDSFPFGTNIRGITIRIHFPGYPSSTDVEKTLKELAKQGRRSKARSMQVSTKDYRVKAEPVTKRKLAQEVSKRVKWHIEDLMNNSDLFPFDCGVEGKWCLGEGLMKFEYMTITAIENVSSGSWSPVIHVDKFLQD
ncbi:hypothetical protein BJ322DRAFT_1017718 [Thelephora terrestris]|uniref:Uncharacterized protein n=1 Tax=Thelephora terrestris TaxID=56493 RepID=A0A9P6HNT2_9AGAM|nr:hypothetical protein BJ322DRAFT_1017718 [Thelephora terrestris]